MRVWFDIGPESLRTPPLASPRFTIDPRINTLMYKQECHVNTRLQVWAGVAVSYGALLEL